MDIIDDIEAGNDHEEDGTVPSHPMAVKPSGNAYTAAVNLKANAGSFAKLPDELLMSFLETLEAAELLQLGGACKFLYAFTRVDELWRALFVESKPTTFTWLGTWRATFLSHPTLPLISCEGVFSNVLHRPYFCAHTPLTPYTHNIPAQNAIPRLSDLSEEEYNRTWLDKPFILTSPVKSWPIYRTWDADYLFATYPSVSFRAEAVDWPLAKYMQYMRHNADESPLYLFDRSFVEKTALAPDAFTPPPCFGADLFAHLGPARPDSRWLIVGPARSGSTMHQDPNGTSAWNAVLRGAKYWLMFQGPQAPPGVVLSPDGAEITAPLSIAEYLLTFHEEARATPGCREGICYPGEVLHVPGGWFHLVLNLEEGVAVTQNFVPKGKLGDVLRFLRDKKEQVSGFRDDVDDPYGMFVERLREACPDVLEETLERMEKKDRGKWEEIKKGDGEGGGFSFGFGFGGDDSDADIP
ncbi:F-box and JmjC domain-containing protein [Trichodelitschia bisporula]|uniref:F-box and JmjC domain-containing protein n=1 Tax=Trichodelitschia bisporula TaxID=703511 RepID=A0A6G1HWP6_9PEZI|nr:F-box and JmjC domain-containing protein [Trichodelitschia bisporula]